MPRKSKNQESNEIETPTGDAITTSDEPAADTATQIVGKAEGDQTDAGTVTAVADQTPPVAEKHDCRYCGMKMPEGNQDIACPMCFRDNMLEVMHESL